MFFDSDYWKTAAQKAFLAPIMSPGSCSVYNGKAEEHAEFAIQVCNEKLMYVKHHQNGKDEYFFKSKEPHDYLDCMSMCFAVAASQGISGTTIKNTARMSSRQTLKKKPRIKLI